MQTGVLTSLLYRVGGVACEGDLACGSFTKLRSNSCQRDYIANGPDGHEHNCTVCHGGVKALHMVLALCSRGSQATTDVVCFRVASGIEQASSDASR